MAPCQQPCAEQQSLNSQSRQHSDLQPLRCTELAADRFDTDFRHDFLSGTHQSWEIFRDNASNVAQIVVLLKQHAHYFSCLWRCAVTSVDLLPQVHLFLNDKFTHLWLQPLKKLMRVPAAQPVSNNNKVTHMQCGHQCAHMATYTQEQETD